MSKSSDESGPGGAVEPAEPMAVLTAEQITAVKDVKLEMVPVPTWGGAVYVRTLTADQRDTFVSRFIDESSGRVRVDVRHVTATLLAMTLCDASGTLLYPDQRVGVKVLAVKAAVVCDPLFDKALHLNGLTAEDIEELAGNSPAPTSRDSPTDCA